MNIFRNFTLSLATWRTMMLKRITCVLLLALVSLQVSAESEDDKWEFGFRGGTTDMGACGDISALFPTSMGTVVDCDDSDTYYGVFGAYRLVDWLAIELGYEDLGDISVGVNAPPVGTIDVSVGTDAFHLSLRPGFKAGPVEFFANLGYSFWDVEGFDGEDLLYGVGVRTTFAERFFVQADINRIDSDIDLDYYGLAAGMTF